MVSFCEGKELNNVFVLKCVAYNDFVKALVSYITTLYRIYMQNIVVILHI